MTLFLSLMIIIQSTTGQFQMEQSPTKCGSGECVVISSCPALLELVFQAKSGDGDAKNQLLERQCGFAKSLPRVCCERRRKPVNSRAGRRLKWRCHRSVA
eukprot:TRINITY_DN29027_c0_g1_i1.p1 TRINITY_DN29027_c0_g1~~TRINITY_DN29027_c0_g1_i1.p1  ORF type:complete len:100 (-),score=26.58 TRINITY_DN29027_c0_g1_i1:452-751(-)